MSSSSNDLTLDSGLPQERWEMMRSLQKPETELTKLCLAKEWAAVKRRAILHPMEAEPSSSTNWGSTVLSIACRGGAPIEAIREIAFACSDQLLVSHCRRGTVLHDAIKHRSPLKVVSFIVKSQRKFEQDLVSGQSDVAYWNISAEPMSVFNKRDYLGRAPLHHMMEWASQWIKNDDTSISSFVENGRSVTRMRWHDRDEMLSLSKELLEAYPDAANSPDVDGQTPLSLLLTIPSTNPQDVGVELRILELVRAVLHYNPSAALGKCHRITESQQDQERSKILSHTPLSCALTYGRSIITVGLLLEIAPQAALIPVGSERELPLHIAVSMRAPVEVIELLLKAAPLSAIAKDKRSLTPICWAWIRHVLDYHIESNSLVKVSRRRYIPSNYFELAECAEQDIDAAVWKSPGEMKKDAMSATFWDRARLLLRAAHHGTINDIPLPKSCGGLGWRPVHAAAAICCPRPIMKIALKLHARGLAEIDEYFKSPLHYAVSRPPYCKGLPVGVFREIHNLTETSIVMDLLDAFPAASGVVDANFQLPLHIAIENIALHPRSIVMKVMHSYADALSRRDGKTLLFPFMQCAAITKTTDDYICACYTLLRENPALIKLAISICL